MIEKKATPKGKSVKVTFQLPANVATEKVAVVGDFNDWNPEKDTMKLNKKQGVWTKAISLKPGNRYQFRYYVDGAEWHNDEAADAYVPNEYFSENSVVEL
jgi:1,4-alpha-glucan branching enzyme